MRAPSVSPPISQDIDPKIFRFHSPRNPEVACSPSHSNFKRSKKVKLSSLIFDRPLASYVLCSLQIVAISRGYLNHVKELNNPIPKEPFFLKPTLSYLPSQTPGAKVEIPRGVLAHHEGISSFRLSLKVRTCWSPFRRRSPDMIFKIPALVEHVSSIMTLEASLFVSPLHRIRSWNTLSTSELTPGRVSALCS